MKVYSTEKHTRSVRSKRWATRRAHKATVIALVDGETPCAHSTRTENQVKSRSSNMCGTREGVHEGQTTSVEEFRDIREHNMISLPFLVQTELGQPHISVAAENNGSGRECLLSVPDRRHQFFPEAGTALSVHATMRSIERVNTDPPRHQSPSYSQGVGKAWNAGSSDCLVKQKSSFASARIAGAIVAVRLVVGKSGESRRGFLNAYHSDGTS